MSQKNILIIGDAGVGKTNLINLLTNIKFQQMYIPTVKIRCHKLNNINLYDTGGQDKYNLSHYPNIIFTDCIIIYDVTNSLSYNSINQWKQKIKNLYQKNKNKINLL